MPTNLSISQSTPGPWTCQQGSCDDQPQPWWDVDGAPEPLEDNPTILLPRGVCMVYGHDGAAEANARLIAAAPTMLAALKDALRLADLQGQPRVVGIMQSAIALAEARQ